MARQIVDVQQHRAAEKLRHNRRDDQEVRRPMDLNDPFGCSPGGETRRDHRRPQRERDVLSHQLEDAGPALVGDPDPVYLDPVERLRRGLPRSPQTDDLDLIAGRRRGLRLPLHPQLADRIVGVDDHAQAARSAGEVARGAVTEREHVPV